MYVLKSEDCEYADKRFKKKSDSLNGKQNGNIISFDG